MWNYGGFYESMYYETKGILVLSPRSDHMPCVYH